MFSSFPRTQAENKGLVVLDRYKERGSWGGSGELGEGLALSWAALVCESPGRVREREGWIVKAHVGSSTGNRESPGRSYLIFSSIKEESR